AADDDRHRIVEIRLAHLVFDGDRHEIAASTEIGRDGWLIVRRHEWGIRDARRKRKETLNSLVQAPNLSTVDGNTVPSITPKARTTEPFQGSTRRPAVTPMRLVDRRAPQAGARRPRR